MGKFGQVFPVGKFMILLLIVIFFSAAYLYYKDTLKLENQNLRLIIYGGGSVLAAGIVIWGGFALRGY